jgi:UDP-glucose 4-epimerase
MRILVTGSSGHLGEALMRQWRSEQIDAIGVDITPSPFTTHLGSIADAAHVARCMQGVDAVLHTATLHKPHVATHSPQAFIDTNLAGTLVLLEAAHAAGVGAFVFTSTTSTFGAALTLAPGAPAVWVTEDLRPVPKNIYGVTKVAAEDLCELFHRQHGLPCIVLRVSRFFPEADDDGTVAARYSTANTQVNEMLNRRVDIEDVVSAHRCAIARAGAIGFGRYIISSTTPFSRAELSDLRSDLAAVVTRHVPAFGHEYARRGWALWGALDRVYDNARARAELGWQPLHDFASAIGRLSAGHDHRSDLALAIGIKAHHPERRNGG